MGPLFYQLQLDWQQRAPTTSLSGMNRTPSTTLRRWSQRLGPDSILRPAIASSLLCWLAFPPVGWGFLSWVAPIGWLTLICRKTLPGRHPYRTVWVAGTFFWLLAVHWIRLPHPMNTLAWGVLASYLGIYLPLFVGLSRVGFHSLRLPLWLVAPSVWTGLELVRAHLIGGFLMGSLAHTQINYPWVIQIADLVGEYGVTFLILLVASCLTAVVFSDKTGRKRGLPLLPACLAIAATLAYGCAKTETRLTQQTDSPKSLSQNPLGGVQRSGKPEPSNGFGTYSKLRVALIQGNSLADWKNDDARQISIMQEYVQLSEQAVLQSQQRDGRNVDLIIWPETAYRNPLYTVDDGYQPPSDRFDPSNLHASENYLADLVHRTKSAIFTGVDRFRLFADPSGQLAFDSFNSSVLIDKQGELVGTYDKMHLVIFGEYVPLANWIPLLKQLTPISGFATPGQQPRALEVDGFTCCPNICYETVIPHLIRRQVTELAASGTMPDALVNLTNDAWFWGSSELDMHLACGVFRAIEMRLPLVIAANGGLSAHVDSCGTVQQVTPRQQAAWLLVDLPRRPDDQLTLYALGGDWFAGLCVVCCVVFGVIGWRFACCERRCERRQEIHSF